MIENNAEYVRACAAAEVVPGRMLIHDNGRVAKPHYIINFPMFEPAGAPDAKAMPSRCAPPS